MKVSRLAWLHIYIKLLTCTSVPPAYKKLHITLLISAKVVGTWTHMLSEILFASVSSIRRLRPKKSMTKKRSERRAIKFSKSECFMIINFSLKGKLSNLCFPLIFLLQKKLSFFFTNWWKPLFEFMTTQTPGLIIFLFLIAFIR